MDRRPLPHEDARSAVVVGFDGLSQGLDALFLAVGLADDTAELIVCCVHPLDVAERGTARRDDAERRLRIARDRLSDRPRTRFTTRGANSPGAGLHEEALQSQATLLVVGSSHRGPMGRIVPGSVTRQALHAAPCAVAVAPLWLQTQGEVSLSEVGVAYDAGPPSKAALAWAAKVARDRGSRLRLVTVLDTSTAGWTGARAWPTDLEDNAREAVGREAREALEDLGEDVEGSVEVVDGAPIHELVMASERLDLLVLGSRGYGPVRRALLGTVSGGVAEAAACPVVVVPRAPGVATTTHAPVVAASSH